MQFFKRAKPRQIMEEEVEELERTRKKSRSAEMLSDALVCRKGRKAGRAQLNIESQADAMDGMEPVAEGFDPAEFEVEAAVIHTPEPEVAAAPPKPEPELGPEDFMQAAKGPVPHKPGPMISEKGRRAAGGGGSVIDRAMRAAELSTPNNREHAA